MDEERVYLPCGHSKEQGSWLGCTDEVCRLPDEQVSALYWAEKGGGRERGAGDIPAGWREA